MFERAADFWLEKVYFAPFELLDNAMCWADEVGGPFASFVTLALLLLPFMLALFFVTVITGLVIVAAVLTAPITLPVSVYLHRRKR